MKTEDGNVAVNKILMLYLEISFDMMKAIFASQAMRIILESPVELIDIITKKGIGDGRVDSCSLDKIQTVRHDFASPCTAGKQLARPPFEPWRMRGLHVEDKAFLFQIWW